MLVSANNHQTITDSTLSCAYYSVPMHLPLTLRQLILCMLTLLLGAGSVCGADAGSDAAHAPLHVIPISRAQLVKHKAASLHANNLDQEARRELTELYQGAIDNIDLADEYERKSNQFRASVSQSREQSRHLRAAIATLQADREHPLGATDPLLSIDDLNETLLQITADETVATAQINQLRLLISALQQRLGVARLKLAEAVDAMHHNALTDGLTPREQPAADSLVTQALDLYQITSRVARQAQIKMLSQELISHNPRIGLLRNRLTFARLDAERIRAKSVALSTWLNQRRDQEAEQAVARSTATLNATAKTSALLYQVAWENAEISKRLPLLAGVIKQHNERYRELGGQLRQVQDSFYTTRQKIESSGTSRALSQLIQTQRRSLPSRKAIAKEHAEAQQRTANLALERVVYEEQIHALTDLDRSTQTMLQDSPQHPDYASLRHLLDARRAMYEVIADWSSRYLFTMNELVYVQDLMVRTLTEYENYLGERLLWVRSIPRRGDDQSIYTTLEYHPLIVPEQWRQLALALVDTAQGALPALLILLLALILLGQRGALQRQLEQSSRFIADPRRDRFSYTLQALLSTLLLVAPLPLMAYSIQLKLALHADDNALTLSVQAALAALWQTWFFISLFQHICRPAGLAERHFGWYQPVLAPLRHQTIMLMIVFIPIACINRALLVQASFGGEARLLQVTMILSLLVLAVFFLNILRLNSDVIQALRPQRDDVALVRLRWLWRALILMVTLALLGLSLWGYAYTADILLLQIKHSIWLLIIITLWHQLSVRWLRVAEKRLQYRALKQKRREIRSAGPTDANTSLEHYKERLIELSALGRDSMQLVNAITFAAAIFGILLVWSDTLPALAHLEDIVIWRFDHLEGDHLVSQVFTLADLSAALLTLAIAIVLYNNLPSVLDLIMLEVFSLPPGTRYTAVNMVRYLILGIGASIALHHIGFEWSRFQWLVAALGVGIGFGLREIVANFFSGMIIMFERPVRVGDHVTIGDIEGMVSRIRLRATNIITLDRQDLLVPNQEFLSGSLLNWSLSDDVLRLIIDVGVAYDSDVDAALELIEGVAIAHHQILTDPAPFATLESFGDNALNLRLRCYTSDIAGRLQTRSILHRAVHRAFKDAGIVIAFPQADLHFDEHQALAVTIQDTVTR